MPHGLGRGPAAGIDEPAERIARGPDGVVAGPQASDGDACGEESRDGVSAGVENLEAVVDGKSALGLILEREEAGGVEGGSLERMHPSGGLSELVVTP